MGSLPPFAPFFLAAALTLVVGGRLRSVVLVALPMLGALNLYHLPDGTLWPLSFLNLELEPVRVDRLSRLFGYLFHIGALLGIVFALHLRDRFESTAALVYAGSALGAVFAGDLVTLVVFWELMAVSSVCLVWARRTERATQAGFRYIVIQVLSGVLLLGGAAAHALDTGALTFTYIGLEGVAGWLIFLAFGVKCAFPFLHNWLTDAYPEATPTGAVFLTAFTTKVAVYALSRGFPGTEMLVWIGVAMTCFPIFYAVIENDLRRVLAYSMINQIGFMVCGIGIGTELAVNGAVASAFAHVIYKVLLMMSMGAVLHMTGRINGSDLGGLYKSMPVTTVLCIVGAASISAFPLFSGFVTKSMVISAALSEGYHWVWLALLFASAGVFHHAGIKIPFFAFFAHDSGIRTTEPPVNMLVAMTIAACLCVLIGCYPRLLYDLLPFATDYTAYDTTHVVTQLQLLFFSALAFVWLNRVGLYPPELPSVNIDVEWVYRRLGWRVVLGVRAGARTVCAGIGSAGVQAGRRAEAWARRSFGPEGRLAETWDTSLMAIVMIVVLCVFLVSL